MKKINSILFLSALAMITLPLIFSSAVAASKKEKVELQKKKVNDPNDDLSSDRDLNKEELNTAYTSSAGVVETNPNCPTCGTMMHNPGTSTLAGDSRSKGPKGSNSTGTSGNSDKTQ